MDNDNDNNIISYVILALIVSLIIHIMFKFSSNAKREHMDVVEPVEKHKIKRKLLPVPRDDEFENNNNYNYMYDFMPDSTAYQTTDDIAKYMEDYVLGGIYKNKPEKLYKEEDINTHRNNFLNFRNNVNMNSHQDDPVDMLNDMYLSGNGDISNEMEGMRIQDVFNNLTKGMDRS
jgi:hypothetical protein